MGGRGYRSVISDIRRGQLCTVGYLVLYYDNLLERVTKSD